MPAPPTYVGTAAIDPTTVTSPKTSGALSVSSGNVVVAALADGNETNATLDLGTPTTSSGPTVTYSAAANATFAALDYCGVGVWTGSAGSTGSHVAQGTCSGGQDWGGNILAFSGSDGAGVANNANAASGQPSVGLTTTQANSAIVLIVADWNASTNPGAGNSKYVTINGSLPNVVLDSFDSGVMGLYIAYYADVGAAGPKTVAMTGTTGLKWAIVAQEIKGDINGGGDSSTLFAQACL